MSLRRQILGHIRCGCKRARCPKKTLQNLKRSWGTSTKRSNIPRQINFWLLYKIASSRINRYTQTLPKQFATSRVPSARGTNDIRSTNQLLQLHCCPSRRSVFLAMLTLCFSRALTGLSPVWFMWTLLQECGGRRV